MKIKDLTLMAVFTALCAVCAWISIPLVVPFTMQTFAVFLACLVLGGCRASISLAVYLLLGAIGIPVFASFNAGVGVLLGPTGGYIVGFVFLGLVYALCTKLIRNELVGQIVGLVAGLVVLYLFGTVWFVFGYTDGGEMSFAIALAKCVVPFILPDAAKMALALFVGRRLKKAIAK